MHTVTQSIQDLGLLGVFLVMLVENLGIPFPTEVGFLVAQGLIQTGQLSYPIAILVITTGHVAGAFVAYGIGRWGDRKLTKVFERNAGWKTTKYKVVRWYERFGSITVFSTRLIGYVRPWSSLVAGFAKLPLAPFLLWTTVGSLIFSIISLSITKYVIAIWQMFPAYHLLMLLIIFVLFFGILTVQLIRMIYDKIRR